jgi:hypothetical protein
MRARSTLSGIVAGAIALSAFLSACSGPPTRDVRATLLNEAGEPVPGAVFYAEAYDAKGPFAFLTAVAGTAGEVPDSAREPLKMPWRPGARIALAAFAPGHRPAVLRAPDRRIESDGALLVLRPAGPEGAWDPAVAELGFPFADSPELSRAAAGSEHGALLRALRGAWEARQALPEPLTDAEQRKLSTLFP